MVLLLRSIGNRNAYPNLLNISPNRLQRTGIEPDQMNVSGEYETQICADGLIESVVGEKLVLKNMLMNELNH